MLVNTTAASPVPLALPGTGGRPAPSRTSALMPSSGPRGRQTRLLGEIHTRRQRPPEGPARQALVARIRRQQGRWANGLEAPLPTAPKPSGPSLLSRAGTCLSDLGQRVGSVVHAVVQALPSFGPAPALAAPAPGAPQDAIDRLFVSHFDFRGFAQSDEAATHRDVVPALRQFFGSSRVTVIPRSGDGAPYLRNLAASTPDGQMLLSGSVPPNYLPLLEVLARYLTDHHIPFAMTEYSVNFANVEPIPELDLLVLADTPPHVILPPDAKADLVGRFGHPAHVVHLELADVRNPFGAELCYDLDMAFLATLNARGEPVALVHWPCIQVRPQGDAIGRDAVRARLQALGLRLIEVGAQDQRALATNALSDGHGRLLMSGPSGSLSADLLAQLAAAGITPVFPDRLWLGHPSRDTLPPYGLHCMTVHLQMPRPPLPQEPAPHPDL